jgi:quinol monooxygenase YgiN
MQNHPPLQSQSSSVVPSTQLPHGAVVLTATIKALAGREAVVRSALLDMVGPSRDEAGCICYNLHESNDEPGLFIFYEQWADQAAFDAHLETPHFLALDAKIDGRTEPPVLAFQTLLG